MNHTPTPWVIRDHKIGHTVIVGGPMREYVNGAAQSQIAMTVGAGGMAEGEAQANAAHIVRCVNGWDSIEALRARISELERTA